LPRRKVNADFEAYNVRNQFWKYFCSREGQVAWQLAHVERVNPLKHTAVCETAGLARSVDTQPAVRWLRHRCLLLVALAFCQ
jgi:hypothetical protein